ncbi:MAG: hypothetical protein LWW81_10610 [Rhodocyclales bacterium]|nr:hypothetical protein [Rhodocyclales bacterium]
MFTTSSKSARFQTLGLLSVVVATAYALPAQAYSDSQRRGFSERRIELPNQRSRETSGSWHGSFGKNSRVDNLREKTTRKVSAILIRR